MASFPCKWFLVGKLTKVCHPTVSQYLVIYKMFYVLSKLVSFSKVIWNEFEKYSFFGRKKASPSQMMP